MQPINRRENSPTALQDESRKPCRERGGEKDSLRLHHRMKPILSVFHHLAGSGSSTDIPTAWGNFSPFPSEEKNPSIHFPLAPKNGVEELVGSVLTKTEMALFRCLA